MIKILGSRDLTIGIRFPTHIPPTPDGFGQEGVEPKVETKHHVPLFEKIKQLIQPATDILIIASKAAAPASPAE